MFGPSESFEKSVDWWIFGEHAVLIENTFAGDIHLWNFLNTLMVDDRLEPWLKELNDSVDPVCFVRSSILPLVDASTGGNDLLL